MENDVLETSDALIFPLTSSDFILFFYVMFYEYERTM